MSLLTRVLGETPDPDAVSRRGVGDVVVLHTGRRPARETVADARALPPDPSHTVVLVDVPGPSWDRLGPALGGDLGGAATAVRLVPRDGEPLAALGGRAAAALQRTVVVADGPLRVGADGGRLVTGPSGRWLRFVPHRSPEAVGRRFPARPWESAATDTPLDLGDGLVVEPLPAGVWLHHDRRDDAERAHRVHLRERVVASDDVLTCVLGAPGTADVPVDAVAWFVRRIPSVDRGLLRLAASGPVEGGADLGDRVAAALGEPVATWTALPVGAPAGVRFHLPDGGSAGAASAAGAAGAGGAASAAGAGSAAGAASAGGAGGAAGRDVTHASGEGPAGPMDDVSSVGEDGEPGREGPHPAAPAPVGPMEALSAPEPVALPAVAGMPALPAATSGPEWAREGGGPDREGAHPAAPAPLGPMEALSTPQPLLNSQPTVSPPTVAPPTVAPPTVAGRPDLPAPFVAEPTAPAEPTRRREGAPSGFLARPAPVAAASIEVAGRDLTKERAWMRRALGARYDTAAAVVARVLSEQPGLRGGRRAADPDLLADLVALRVHLGDDEAARRALAVSLQTGRPGPHTPFARGVAAGLARMPAHRGPVGLVVDRAHRHGADPGAVLDGYGSHEAVVEHGLLLTGPAAGAVPGEDEIAVLAVATSARRTGALDPERPDRFGVLPGTRYRVLAVDRAARTVWLREAFAQEPGEVATRLDDQARAALEAVVPVVGTEPVRGGAPGLAPGAGGTP